MSFTNWIDPTKVECSGCPFCNAVDMPEIERDLEFRPCPYCDTLADEYGYCVDVGCKYCGKAVIENG